MTNHWTCGGEDHPTCPIVTTDANGTLPNIQAQNTVTNTDVATVGTGVNSATYVARAGLSYQEYMQAIDVLAQIAVGGTAVMDQSFANLVENSTAYSQTNVITNQTTTVNGVSNAVIPMVDVEQALRAPGAVTSNPAGGFEPVGGNSNVAKDQLLPRLDTTRIADIVPILGNNSIQVGPNAATDTIQRLSTNPDKTDQLNKFSNLTDPANPSAPRKMDVSVVSNDSILLINHAAGTSVTTSRIFNH